MCVVLSHRLHFFFFFFFSCVLLVCVCVNVFPHNISQCGRDFLRNGVAFSCVRFFVVAFCSPFLIPFECVAFYDAAVGPQLTGGTTD